MADPQADVTNRSDQSADEGDRPDKTVTMDEIPLATPETRGPADVLRQLDQVSSVVASSVEIPNEAIPDVILPEPADLQEAGESDDDSDPSVEKYVAGLIARSKENSPESPSDAWSGSTTQTFSQAPKTPVPATSTDLAAKPQERSAVRHEPESQDVITNLRDLANMNARSVLDIHNGHCLIVQMHSKLAVAMVSIIISFALISMTVSSSSLTFYAAICALIASFVWSFQYFGLARRLHKACRQTEEIISSSD